MKFRETHPSQPVSTLGPWHPVDASGGIESFITVSGVTYKLHMFTTVGNSSLVINDSGSDGSVEFLVVGGGGGGGMDMGGGGGGGGVIEGVHTVRSGEIFSVTVGSGGLGGPGGSERRSDAAGPQPGAHQFTIPATSGGNSIFGPYTAIGGGFGGSSYRGYTPGITGGNGGSGGGASGYNDNAGTFNGGTGTSGQGSRGGKSTAAYYSGGGGGAGGQGADSTSQPNGGSGRLSRILGTDLFWGGGGGGASYSLSTGGNGGIGGGGGGAVGSTSGGAGLNPGQAGGGGSPNSQTNTRGGNAGANTGGGGGGGSHYNATNSGGEGGSGIVVIRYPINRPLIQPPVPVKNSLQLCLDATFIESAPGSGNYWYDLSNNRLHATGSSAITSQRLISTQRYQTAQTDILNTDTHSIFFSIQINGTSGNWDKIFGFEPDGTDRSPGVWRWPSSRRLHWRYDPSNTSSDFSLDSIVDNSGTEFAVNTWYYVGVVKNGATTTRYVNGNVIGSGSVSNPKSSGTSPVILFPAHSGDLARIRHVHIYNRALSTQEVLQNYNAIAPTLV